jgi:hypothetical protein
VGSSSATACCTSISRGVGSTASVFDAMNSASTSIKGVPCVRQDSSP